MAFSERIKEALIYTIMVIITFAVMQFAVILMHEFTHSTVAWLFGDMTSPLDIVWGNPVLMTGWDEGVHYSRLFPSGHHAAEAIIGGSPLFVHTAMVILGLLLMQRKWTIERKRFFHVLYWFVIANLMELIAYIVMRPFAAGGDTGHFNRGLGLSPWLLFIGGTLAIMVGLYVLFVNILPRLCAVFARGNSLTEKGILWMSAFFLFLWGSGLRVVIHVYPDPQWMFGLFGFAAFVAALIVFRPHRSIAR